MIEKFSEISRDKLVSVAEKLRELLLWNPGAVVLLSGEMGAGKTTFTSTFVNLFTREEYVNSPTFNLYNVYETPDFPIYHFDLYRLRDAAELENLEIEEILGKKGICLIEWWEIAKEYLPPHCVEVHISDAGNDTRDIEIRTK